MSNFDPNTFLNTTLTDIQVKRPPLSAGADFVGIIGEVKARQWQKKDDPSKNGIAVDVPVTIDLNAYPAEKARLGGGVESVTINDSLMLDITEEGLIDLAPGKNSKLRKYRDALGMNAAGAPFSFLSMPGRPIKVKISHREYEGELFDQIAGIAKA